MSAPTSPFTVRGVTLDARAPAIIVPLVARTEAELLAQAHRAITAGADLLEWRVDHLLASCAGPRVETLRADDVAALVACGRRLREVAGEVPLLITVRTYAEGGEVRISASAYGEVYGALLRARVPDLVDVEVARERASDVVGNAHVYGAHVVGSYHDHASTPSREEITARLAGMADLGADLLKIAVTPRSPADVLALLGATWDVHQRLPHPLLTIAMGGLGLVTRVAGGVFGSVATFALVDHASAPGQVPVAALRPALELLSETHLTPET